MLRLIGILIGSAFAIGLLLITLGRPQLAAPDSGFVSSPPVEESADLVVNAGTIEDQPAAALETPDAEPEIGTGNPDAGDGGNLEQPEPETQMAMVDQLFAPEASRSLVLPETAATITEEHWYAFWSPFRSEIAANGFVAKLQESTGIDYRVVKVKTGVYEVAFAYTDDADIETKLGRIAAATGLDMSGS